MAGISTRLREFACLTELGGCGALPGERCTTRSGTPMAEVHAARWDQSHAAKPAAEADAPHDVAWVDELADEISRSVWDQLLTAMLARGEDPTDDELWRTRKAQLGWALKARGARSSDDDERASDGRPGDLGTG